MSVQISSEFTAFIEANRVTIDITQCSKCKENFMGNPVDNQQCYRKISVMQEFLIGSQTAETEDKQVIFKLQAHLSVIGLQQAND